MLINYVKHINLLQYNFYKIHLRILFRTNLFTIISKTEEIKHAKFITKEKKNKNIILKISKHML